MPRMVKCPFCEEAFLREETDYVQLESGSYKGRYAHRECAKKEEERKRWVERIHNKVKSVCGNEYQFSRVNMQIKQNVALGRTEEGIYKTLCYWYDVKNSDPSLAHGGIGIVPHIYDEANRYWDRKEQVQKQLREKDINKYVPRMERRLTPQRQPFKKPVGKTYFVLK